jgi:hypothetical protein
MRSLMMTPIAMLDMPGIIAQPLREGLVFPLQNLTQAA